MGSISDSVMNWGQLFAMKQRMDANARAQAEADATKRYLAEQVGMLRPGDQTDLSTLPDSSILDRQYQLKQQTDWAAQQRDLQRQNMQAAVNELHQGGKLRYVLDDKFFQKAADLGVVIPEDGIPDRFKPADPTTLDSITGEFDEPVPAYLRDPRMYGNQEDALKAIAEYGKTAAKKKPEYTVDQLQAIPGFGSMSPEHQAAAVAAVQSTGKAPTQEFWMQAMAPKDTGGPDKYTEKEIQAGLATKALTQRDADVLRAAGGRAAVGNEMFRNAGERKQFDAAREKLLRFKLDVAESDMAAADKYVKEMLASGLVQPGEPPPPGFSEARGRMQTAWQAREEARSKLESFLSGADRSEPDDAGAAGTDDAATPQSESATRDEMRAIVKQLRDQGASDETIRGYLLRKFKGAKK